MTRSPWNPERTPGGSSGGSAAALAGCVVPLVTASDGGGSTRIPASFVGAFGLKPTYGRIPHEPHRLWYFGDTAVHGPLTKTVADNALYLDLTCGYDRRDPKSLPHPGFSYRAKLAEGVPRKLRIGYSPDLGYAVVQSDVAQAVYDAVRVFEKLGHSVEEIKGGPPKLGEAWGVFGSFEMAAAHLHLLPEHEAEFQRGVLASMKGAWDMTPEWFSEAAQARPRSRPGPARCSRVRPAVTPTVPYDPPPAKGPFPSETEGRRQLAWGVAAFTIPFNLSLHPACSLRVGLSRAGLPIGMQIVAERHRDELVLQAAQAFERERPWHPHWPSRVHSPDEDRARRRSRRLRVQGAPRARAAPRGPRGLDFGTKSTESCDYPDFAIPAVRGVAEGKAERAILCCTNGIGMAMVANRMPGVRGALVYSARTAAMTRQHHDSNVLCLGAGEFPAARCSSGCASGSTRPSRAGATSGASGRSRRWSRSDSLGGARRARGRRGLRPRDAAHAADRLAAARAPRGLRGLGQAREPRPLGLVQGARRAHLRARAARARARSARRDRRDARQPRPERAVRRAPRRARGDDRGAARQQRREERGDARARRAPRSSTGATSRKRSSTRSRSRSRRASTSCRRSTSGSCAAWRPARSSCSARGPTRRPVRADRARLRRLRRAARARGARRADADRRGGRRERADLRAVVRGGPPGADRLRGHLRRRARRASAERRGGRAHLRRRRARGARVRGRDPRRDARAVQRHPQRRRGRGRRGARRVPRRARRARGQARRRGAHRREHRPRAVRGDPRGEGGSA